MTDDTKPTKPSLQSIGGRARATKLSTEERSAIAKKAARARWKLDPVKATHSGTIKIGDLEIECAVLPGGQRVLSERAVLRALGRPIGGMMARVARGQDGAKSKGNPERIGGSALPETIKPYVPDEFVARDRVVPYTNPKHVDPDQVLSGVQAEALPMLCEAWLHARRAGVLKTPQMTATAAQAEVLVSALARVGIVALVDEASGYQAVRDQDALQAILDRYLRTELAAWAKRFPDEFYRQIFRLRGWEWRGMKVNRPGIVGYYTKDLVYARLAPGLLEELQSRQPRDPSKGRKGFLHQWLTDDIGCPALSQHLHATIALMRVSKTWTAFMGLMDAALPKRDDTLTLPIMTEGPQEIPE